MTTVRPILAVLSAVALIANPLLAQTVPPLPSPNALKKMTIDELMDIEVTSVSKRPEKLAEVPSAIQLLTGDEIRRAGATSIPEALRLAGNLEVAQIDARQWAITARGFNNVFADKMLVLIDGRTVYTPLYAGVYWDVQDTLLADLDRIEVISGPGATQWGANAVNGVINITTKSAKDTQGGWLSVGGGTELRNAEEFRYGGRLAPNFYYRVYGKYADRGDSLRLTGQADDAWRTRQGGFRLDYEPSATDTFTLQGDTYSGDMSQVGPDNIRTNGGNVVGRWSRQFEENSDLKLQVYFDRTFRSIPGSFTQAIDTYDLDFQHRRPLGPANDFMWGFGARIVQDDVVNTPANAFLPSSVGHGLYSAFAQDEITLVKDHLNLTFGTKLEHNDYTGYEVEPSARLAWRLDSRQMLWAAISRAVRTPSRIDRDLYSPATPPYRVTGGSNVVSEKLIAYEVGYRLQLESRLALSLSTYINTYDDLRSLLPLNPPQAFPVETSSGLRGHSSCAELAVEWQAARAWRLRAGWTELRAHSEPQPGNVDRPTRDSIVRDPNHQAFLRSSLDLSPGVEVDATLRYVGPINLSSVPGYTEADLRLGWHPVASWEFSILGQNLLHPEHPEFNAPGNRRQLQRAVFAKSSWRF